MPYFISFSPQTNIEKIAQMQSELSFSFNQPLRSYREVQPDILLAEINNPLLKHERTEAATNWNNLPPVLQLSINFISKPGSKILSTIKVNNNVIDIPLIVTWNFNGKRSVAVLAGDIWKWKLQTARKNLNLFDSFILNCVKWLNTKEEQDRISVKTSKRNYSPPSPSSPEMHLRVQRSTTLSSRLRAPPESTQHRAPSRAHLSTG